MVKNFFVDNASAYMGGGNFLNCNPLGRFGLHIHSICFFSLGCMVAIGKRSLFYDNHIWNFGCSIISLVSITTIVFFSEYSEMVRLPLLITLSFLMIQLCKSISRDANVKWPKEFSMATFFVYIYHGVLVIIDKHLLLDYFVPKNSFQALTVYFLVVIVLFLQLIFCYYLLRRYCPKLLSLLLGSR